MIITLHRKRQGIHPQLKNMMTKFVRYLILMNKFLIFIEEDIVILAIFIDHHLHLIADIVTNAFLNLIIIASLLTIVLDKETSNHLCTSLT